MLAAERHREILARIERAAGVRVTELARDLRVTEETIRRDLHKLADRGRLIRIHGGAVSVREGRRDLSFELRQVVHLDRKRAIAAEALKHIEEDDVIAVDASSTVREFVRLIPDIPLTIVTNSINAITDLADRERVRVVSTGGVLSPRSLSFVGSFAEDALRRFNIRKLFLSCKGIDRHRGLSEAVSEHAHVKRWMIETAESSILLADGSKFGLRAVEFFADLADVDLIITDSSVDAEVCEDLSRIGVRIEIAG